MSTNTATTKLNALFEQWVKKHPKYQGHFAKDGINDESIYNTQNPKLLFICKEPNDKKQREGDFREWWTDPKEYKYLMGKRICDWAYGVFNEFPPLNKKVLDNKKEQTEIMKSIAFMNLKKIGGGSSANSAKIRKAVEREKSLIAEEIKIINPDVIIGGIGRDQQDLWGFFFPDIEFVDSGFDISVAKYKSYKVIHYYHPSYIVPRAMSYSLLGRVYQSKTFQNL